MNNNNTTFHKGIVKFGIILAVSVVTGILFMIYSIYSDNKTDEARFRLVHNVQFEGKVINSRVYNYGGRKYFMICVKLDYSNLKEFYICNDLCFIKIKNNIATMDVGYWDDNYGIPDYVVVNVKNCGIEAFKFPGGHILTRQLALPNFGLTAKDMTVCN